MGMKAIGVKYFIPTYSKDGGILSAQGIVITVDDNGSGVYLKIEGRNFEPDADESSTEFYLESEKQIDDFATEAKRILRAATQ